MKLKSSIKRITLNSFAIFFIALVAVILIIIVYSFRSFIHMQVEQRALAISDIVKAGLTAHMKAGVMEKRGYFLQEVALTHGIKTVQIIRSQEVVAQFGKGDIFESTLSEEKRLNKEPSFDWNNEDQAIMKATIPYLALSKGRLNCLSCHAVPEGTVLGAIEIYLDISTYQSTAMRSIIVIFIFIALFVLFIILNMNHVLEQHVTRPLKRLIADTIVSYEKNEHIAVDEYKSKEFEEVIFKFNQLSDNVVSKQQQLEYKNQELRQLNSEIEQTLKESMQVMGEIESYRSGETKLHTTRVVKMSTLLAQLIHLSEKDIELIGFAASLHDIGKLGIPDSILLKEGHLSEEERTIIKTHPLIAKEMLKYSQREIFTVAQAIASEHHEHYNGEGYPLAIKGDEISVYARVVAIIDVFDALYNRRVYKEAWQVEDIINFFNKRCGAQFDPFICDVFIDNIDRFVAIQKLYSKE